MAGTPKKRAMIAELTRRAKLELDDEVSDELAPLYYCAMRVASGTTLVDIAHELTVKLRADGVLTAETEVRRDSLYKYLTELRQKAGDEGASILVRARARGAHSIAEGARRLVANTPAVKDELTKAKLQVETDLWLAERLNREDFGQQKQGVQVAISFNGMHLDALRARSAVIEQHDQHQLTGGSKQLGAGVTGASAEPIEVEHEVLSD